MIRCDGRPSKPGKVINAETKYFGQTDMDDTIYALYRKRYTADLIYQERWMPGTRSWKPTIYLMRLITGGDCTITEITHELAKSSFPEAFSMHQIEN